MYENDKKKGSGCLTLIASCIAAVIAAMAVFALFDKLQRAFLVGNDWIFFEPQPYAEKILTIGITVAAAVFFLALAYKYTGAESAEDYYFLARFLVRHKKAALTAAVLLLAAGFTGISSVSEDHVTRYSIFHPGGEAYTFDEIESVDTGFSRKGDFYYRINVGGHTLAFSAPTVNTDKYPEYEASDYREFSDFDSGLMSEGIKKNADTASADKAYYSEDCMENIRAVLGTD